MLAGKKRSKALVKWGHNGELLKEGKEVGARAGQSCR